MHLKDLLGSITRVGYCIPYIYLVPHCLPCTVMDLSNLSHAPQLDPANEHDFDCLQNQGTGVTVQWDTSVC